jgi:hypothetical protein
MSLLLSKVLLLRIICHHNAVAVASVSTEACSTVLIKLVPLLGASVSIHACKALCLIVSNIQGKTQLHTSYSTVVVFAGTSVVIVNNNTHYVNC